MPRRKPQRHAKRSQRRIPADISGCQCCIRYSISKAKPTSSICTKNIEKDFSIPNTALPDVIDLLVDQRNSLVHNYQHSVKPEVDWEWIWVTIEHVYPELQKALEAELDN